MSDAERPIVGMNIVLLGIPSLFLGFFAIAAITSFFEFSDIYVIWVLLAVFIVMVWYKLTKIERQLVAIQQTSL